MTRRLARSWTWVAIVGCLSVATIAHAGDAPPPDEWWKRAKPPKKHGPVTWSVGGFAGMQSWAGLDDYAPSSSERTDGWRGAFDVDSPICGIVGSIEARRYGTIGVGVDMFLESFSNATSETAIRPGPGGLGELSVDYVLDEWRLGVAGRAVFRSGSRVQPTTSLGLAWAHVSVDSVTRFPSSGLVQSGRFSADASLDVVLTGGFDVALQRIVRKGWRARFEVGIEHRGFNETSYFLGDREPGSVAYKAVVGIVYRHEPTAPAP